MVLGGSWGNSPKFHASTCPRGETRSSKRVGATKPNVLCISEPVTLHGEAAGPRIFSRFCVSLPFTFQAVFAAGRVPQPSPVPLNLVNLMPAGIADCNAGKCALVPSTFR